MTDNVPPHAGLPTFAALRLKPALEQVLDELSLLTMTPIQAQSIPLLLAGRDLIGQSKTGSGKTAAFALPILERVELARRRVQTLIIAPTRELCGQVEREMRRFGRRLPGLHVQSLAGGQPIRPQMASLEKGVHIAVGTPGRIVDHLQRDSLDLRSTKTVVLDEADRMLEMGFREDIELVMDRAPSARQTVLFSATFPREVETIAAAYLRNPARVVIEHADELPSAEQVVILCDKGEKTDALIKLLSSAAPKSGIVFCNLKVTANDVAESLRARGWRAAPLHGDLLQDERNLVMAKLRNGTIALLVATDVAARGIDVAGLDLVVNYDLPLGPDVYVHRVGRTGRAGRSGLAWSLASPREAQKIQVIEQALGRDLPRQTLAELVPRSSDEGLTEGRPEEMATLLIGGGRRDKLRPGDVLGALTGEAGCLSASDVGKIETHDRLTYVAVSRRVVEVAVERLKAGRIKGRRFYIEWCD